MPIANSGQVDSAEAIITRCLLAVTQAQKELAILLDSQGTNESRIVQVDLAQLSRVSRLL